ncbi:unnamed protein product [Echinostoma caproni]|uniref:Uncharacterized protein n=1 Tax=Echinostoma caproni TaxID=27848 RepID=A0A3P8IED5_9TREM|nr:unnamed protein product [Echinostoma caproni]
MDIMRLTLAEFGQQELTPVAVAKCICLFLRMAEVKPNESDRGRGLESNPLTTVGMRRQDARRASHQADQFDSDTQMILRTGSSGALWREAGVSGCGTSGSQTARPSSLFVPNSICDHLPSSSLSASEPRLNQLDSEASQLSFTSRSNESYTNAAKWNMENFLIVLNELNPTLGTDQADKVQFDLIMSIMLQEETVLDVILVLMVDIIYLGDDLVIVELDCPEFFITSRAAFALLKQFLFRGNRSGGLEILCYRPWNNAQGQLSLLRHCFTYPDVICLAYYPFRCVDLSLYRLSPSEDQALMQIW